MGFRDIFKDENEQVRERFDLTVQRIGLICGEESVQVPYRKFFMQTAFFIMEVAGLYESVYKKELDTAPLDALQELNILHYRDILPENYGCSYANPAYAVEVLGEDYGQLLSFLYAEIRNTIIYAYESRRMDFTILNEAFIEIYNLFEGECPAAESVKDVLYWYLFDYSDRLLEYRVRECIDPELDFAASIIMDSDLDDLRYLYRFGDYISDAELKTAGFLNSLPEKTVRLMADTYTEGYCRGFEVMGRDLRGKKTVLIRYPIGFERMIRMAIENFRKIGLEPVICRAAVESINKNPNRKAGYFAAPPNRQYEYDHRYDSGLYLDKRLKERKLSVLKSAYETYREAAAVYAGPAVVETFGEDGFFPVNKPEAVRLTKKQEKIALDYANESSLLINEYIPGDETSFTIIAFPVPQIGPDFEKIFEETIAINTLDYKKYQKVQQRIIDALDQASSVHVTGKGDNSTDLVVRLHPLKDRTKETNFENCLSDVNIPLGEVFTSPLLANTNGTLAVSKVYIGEVLFENLTVTFEDGMAKEYSCDNFDSAEEGKALVKQIILRNHETLPLGEFAIGTNTAAYVMARKYGILHKLPILIVEKMGPHFAVGDTCYSRSEDSPVFNPDGKEVTARDNEISALRKKDISKAYFSCHVDITIPYAELDQIEAVHEDGKRVTIIKDGRFVLPGTEELNKAIDDSMVKA